MFWSSWNCSLFLYEASCPPWFGFTPSETAILTDYIHLVTNAHSTPAALNVCVCLSTLFGSVGLSECEGAVNVLVES